MIRTLAHLLSTILLAFFVFRTENVLAAGPPDERFELLPGNNLALGKPYTFSQWPHFKSNMVRPKNDFMTMLTDGEYASLYTRYNRYLFSLVPEAVSFQTEGAVSVTADLGAVHPIAEILCRHDSSGNATAQPRKEEYFVSLEGETFYKVGQRINVFDPRTIEDDDYRSQFYNGTKVWSSGPLTTKARYVKIKTYPVGYIDVPPFASNITKTYVGYDEIAVRKGDFDVSEATLDTSHPEVDLERHLPASILGYALNPPPFHALFKEGPMEIFTFPMGVFGDSAYHLSVDAPYILMFKQITNGETKIEDFQFTLWLPDTIATLDPPQNWKIDTSQETRDEKPYRKMLLTWEDPRNRKERGDTLPFFTLKAKQETPGDLGAGYFSWSYTLGDKRYSAKERTVAFRLDPRISVPRPKRFINGEWQPRKTITHKASTVAHFQDLYKGTGFNALLTAYRKTSEGPAKYQQAKQLGFSVYHVSLVCPNGVALKYYNEKWYDDHPAYFRFRYHPQYLENTPERVQAAMCPHVLASQELEPLLVESLKIELETADHVYVNWEPYYYMKRGCICENCKTSFQSFSGTPAEEVDNVWPDIVIDRQSTLHNRFASWQHGNVVKALEQATQKAGQALGKDSVAHFLISTSADFSPHADRHQWQNPNCYLDSVGQVILWGTGTKALPLGTVDLPWIIGQGFRGNQYEDVNALAAPFRKKSGKRHHPKFIFLPAVSFDGEGRLVYPKVFAFNTILTLFEGFQGHASYSENGVDARYFSARAHASHYLANFEDAALDGDPLWDVTVTPVSEIPVLTARGGELTVLYHKALTYKGQTILALGNDDLVPHYVRVQFTPAMNSDSVWLFDPVKRLALGGEKGFSSNQLRSGILIEVPPKDFVVLRSETERASVLQYGAHVESQIRLKERFEKIKTRLSRRAQAVTSFAD